MNGFRAALATATVDKPTNGKKKTIPEIEHPPINVAEAIDEHERLKVVINQAKAAMALPAQTILDYTQELQDQDGFAGNFHNSYKLHGNIEAVTVVYSNVYSINKEDKDELKSILGNKFDDLIKTKYEVSLNEAVLQNESLQNELLALIGPENFKKFFVVKENYVVVDDFKKLVYRYMKPKQLEKLRVFVKQKKASIK